MNKEQIDTVQDAFDTILEERGKLIERMAKLNEALDELLYEMDARADNLTDSEQHNEIRTH